VRSELITPATTRAWTRIRKAAESLTPEVIEQIAQRVAELLRREPGQAGAREAPARLLDAEELARHLGVTRWWVYQHADELGAIRIGGGPRARLRFDVTVAKAALDSARGRPPALTEAPYGSRTRRRRVPVPDDGVPLLPVTPRRVRGLLPRWPSARRMRR
jgi:hypothetical protein